MWTHLCLGSLSCAGVLETVGVSGVVLRFSKVSASDLILLGVLRRLLLLLPSASLVSRVQAVLTKPEVSFVRVVAVVGGSVGIKGVGDADDAGVVVEIAVAVAAVVAPLVLQQQQMLTVSLALALRQQQQLLVLEHDGAGEVQVTLWMMWKKLKGCARC